jgi:uncharacterized membrane protein
VFGFAITLLVVSLEVPANFDQLLQVMRGLPVFAVTFAILLMMWQEHHTLFKRFPCADGVTIWLNGALLFVVVSYIYPLKFLFSGIVGPAGMRFGQTSSFIRLEQMMTLMLVYGAGFAAIFLLFAAMYWRAARREADPAGRHEARVAVGHSFVYVGVAASSMVLAVFGGNYASAYSGMAYGLTGPCQALYHGLTSRYWKPPLAAALQATPPDTVTPPNAASPPDAATPPGAATSPGAATRPDAAPPVSPGSPGTSPG